MTTVEVNILADDDQEFVINILNALAQKQIIDFALVNQLPNQLPQLTSNDLIARVNRAEQGRSYSAEEALKYLSL